VKRESHLESADEVITVGGLHLTILCNPVYTERDELVKLYWLFHPRFIFLKNARYNATVLDLGAGSGGLATWCDWSSPKREDIRMYAVDMIKGALFDRYVDFQLCNLDSNALKFEDDFFDAIIGSHVLEHVSDETALLDELRRVARKGARVYLEVPTPESQSLPSRQLFLDAGINVSTLNFFDDATHLRTFSLEKLSSLLRQTGFKVLSFGVIDNRYLEDEMLTYGIRHNDMELTTYGMWSKTHFAQYIISEAV